MTWISTHLIDVTEDQPRRTLRPEAMDELTASIRQHGVLQPLRVRACEGRYELIAGQRRLLAARRAGLTEVPVMITETGGRQALIEALIENIQREDLSPIDRGESLRRLRVHLGAQSWEEVGRSIGISRRHVYHLLNVTALPEPIREDIQVGRVNEKHGRALQRLRDRPELQMELWRRIVSDNLSGDEALGRARMMLTQRPEEEVEAASRQPRRSAGEVEADLGERVDALLRMLPKATMREVRPLRKRLETLLEQLSQLVTDAFHAEDSGDRIAR
jgi:ParB family chromosome partitioning protein